METIRATIIQPNQAIRLRARKETRVKPCIINIMIMLDMPRGTGTCLAKLHEIFQNKNDLYIFHVMLCNVWIKTLKCSHHFDEPFKVHHEVYKVFKSV